MLQRKYVKAPLHKCMIRYRYLIFKALIRCQQIYVRKTYVLSRASCVFVFVGVGCNNGWQI